MNKTHGNGVPDLVIVLDFGAQYNQLIARRVRECHVYCEILPSDTPTAELLARQPKGIIFSGGPSSVYEEGALSATRPCSRPASPSSGFAMGCS
jgi:GMP synthase (glutamine-hydrolysing)